jgi:hypothetical protein
VCANCVKRDAPELCVYAEIPEDEKTRNLRARLENLETQVREITSSLAAAESNNQSESPEETPEVPNEDFSLIENFARLRLEKKDGKQVYYGPNTPFAIIASHPEVFEMYKIKRREAWPLIKSNRQLLDDEPIATGFPFTILAPDASLQSFLPEKSLCDQLVVRYLDCCNSLYPIIDFETYCEQYPLLWSEQPPPTWLLAQTFLIIAIAARSLNPGHWLLAQIFSNGQLGALRAGNRWKKYGELALSQTGLLRKSRIDNMQGTLLLGLLEQEEHVRWNLLGMLGNMARVAGLHRDPNIFQELDEKGRNLRRYSPLE